MAGGLHPPFSFFLKKKTGRARSKRKSLFIQTCPCGQVWGCGRLIASFPQSCHASSECAETRLSTRAHAASCHAFANSRVLIEAPYLWPRCRSAGGVSKEGAAAPSLCRLKGRSRRGRPKSPSWRVFWTVHGPFSPRGENGGCIAHLHRGVTHPERMPPPSFENTHTPVFSPCASCILASHSARRQWGHTATRT